jgi:hypothetical protein
LVSFFPICSLKRAPFPHDGIDSKEFCVCRFTGSTNNEEHVPNIEENKISSRDYGEIVLEE